ncbi:MAG TPA: ABC transporter ATP-binding protein [Polyangiaceae bacterium]|nr:ABC transporter ATP-binding protein [Polyangiaceae bacterium]
METERTTGEDAERLRELIRKDVHGGLSALVDFANARAVTPRLKHEALVLKGSQREVTSAEELRAVERQMLELTRRIEADHAARWNEREAEAKRERLDDVRAEYLSRVPEMPPVAVGRNLGKGYPGTDFRLTGVNLTLRPGEVTAVVGQNANGKTTLLRTIAGELRADEGSLHYPGLSQKEAGDWANIKAQIAYLPQDLPVWRGSLLDNLHYDAALHGLLGDDNEREVEFFTERLGLSEHVHKRWAQLSGGYKLRFALARVLIWKPKLLVLDEPLANLDIVAQSRLLQDIVDLARSPRYPVAVLMSSQHLHELEAVANNVVFLRKGDVVFNGSMQDIGEHRSYNLYELGTTSDPERLRELFDDPRYEAPFHNGVSYVIKTATNVQAAAVIAKLLGANIQITYFRDISRSIKSLFE